MVDKQEAKGFDGTIDKACQFLWERSLDLWSTGFELLASAFGFVKPRLGHFGLWARFGAGFVKPGLGHFGLWARFGAVGSLEGLYM